MNVGYHFTGDTLRDGRPIPPIGETLRHEGPVRLCLSGLHWSRHAFDALLDAPGPILHRVECSAPVFDDGEKCVSTERTIVASIDATRLLRSFAADQALSVAHLWDMPAVVRDYLTTLDPTLRAAAWAGAWEAAWDAAWAAAMDDAMDAARAAARDDLQARVDAAFAALEQPQ